MSEDTRSFQEDCKMHIDSMKHNQEFAGLSRRWLSLSAKEKYTYQFRWMGRPIIQLPTDIVAMQDVIWRTKPDLIIETGVAHGGSVIFSASMLQLLGGDGHVVGIDIDIREHNRREIEKSPVFPRITLLEGSSTDKEIVNRVYEIAKNYHTVMVILDSCHTESHVLNELQAYSPLVSNGCYLVVYDTSVEYMPDALNSDRPWSVGNNPSTAVKKFLESDHSFEVDHEIESYLMITNAPNGWLRKKG